MLTSNFCRNTPILCLPLTPLPTPLISEFAFTLTNEAPETSRNGPSAASHQIDHTPPPPRGASRTGPLDVLRHQPPHFYLMIYEDEISYFHTWLRSHQKTRESTLQAFQNPHHYYNIYLKYVYTHSVLVIACLILVVAKLSDATIEHRLRWALSVWKVYIRESL